MNQKILQRMFGETEKSKIRFCKNLKVRAGKSEICLSKVYLSILRNIRGQEVGQKMATQGCVVVQSS